MPEVRTLSPADKLVYATLFDPGNDPVHAGEYFSQDVINRARYVRTNTAPIIEPVSAGIPETTV
jgi:hypothetical protein